MTKVDIELNTVYRPPDLPRKVLECLVYPFRQEVIPTEHVITKWGEVVTPIIKRIYSTGLYWYVGVGEPRVMDYDELRQTPNFHGTSYHLSVVMEEIWEDYGDDGHIFYKFQGYMFKVAANVKG